MLPGMIGIFSRYYDATDRSCVRNISKVAIYLIFLLVGLEINSQSVNEKRKADIIVCKYSRFPCLVRD